jgi:hypothetical protein
MPADKLKKLATRAAALWRIVRLFREVGLMGVPAASAKVTDQTTRILDILDPATQRVSEINQPGYRDKILVDTTEAATSAAKSAIDKSTIVLAHSILDDVVSECCQISALLTPENWMTYVEKRKVELRVVLETPAADLAKQLLDEYLDQLSRESLRKRLDMLNERYQPAPAFEYDDDPYRFDRDRLEGIDRHRQRVIHQLELSNGGEDVSADLAYLEATCFFVIFMIAHKHGIAVDPLSDALDGLYARARSPFDLAYEGFLLATSLPSPEAALWSWGGQIFAREPHRKSKQLPLLMPAATPDLSADGRQIAFVRYRLATGDEVTQNDRLEGNTQSLIGDIWIAAVDGSHPELVLTGGPRPDLVPPVATLPKELAGITSTKFDPDAQLVYFIADAWATSGAIYVLDLKTRGVRYFTDGTVFAVLQSEPHRGSLLVSKHRYFEGGGSYDHFWLVSPEGTVGEDVGPDLEAALVKLYGPGGRKLAFPHLD